MSQTTTSRSSRYAKPAQHQVPQQSLLHPVALDRDGRVIDGRNRLKACEIASVEPTYITYEGDDPDTYALSANVHRRNLTKGQIAMITAKACSLSEQSSRPPSGQSSRSLSEHLGASLGTVGKANIVLQHAPDLVNPIISGATGLNETYAVAQENKAKANSTEVQLARLQEEDTELADRVVEGHLTLAGAWAERTERVEENKRQRRVATRRNLALGSPGGGTGCPSSGMQRAHPVHTGAKNDRERCQLTKDNVPGQSRFSGIRAGHGRALATCSTNGRNSPTGYMRRGTSCTAWCGRELFALRVGEQQAVGARLTVRDAPRQSDLRRRVLLGVRPHGLGQLSWQRNRADLVALGE